MLQTFSLPLLLLIGVFALAISAIVGMLISSRQRRAVLRRAVGAGDVQISAIRTETVSPFQGLIDWLEVRVPAQLGMGTVRASRLVHAGFESAAAGRMYGLLRVVSLVLCTGVALWLAPTDDAMLYGAVVIIGVGLGLLVPTMLLDHMVKARKLEIRRAIPDTLDLLVVCVEAGVALDAAVQRVSQEMKSLYPTFAAELMGMSRRIGAGMPRDQAMHGLYLRTGVEELRSLGSHMLQSENWGTSISTVLRQYSEQLRRMRKVTAEKRAATASTRMLIPLMLFIFPTLFVILLGPAVLRIMTSF